MRSFCETSYAPSPPSGAASEGNELRSTSPILPRLSNGAELLRKAFHLNTGRSSQQVASRSSAPDETFAGSEVDPRSLV